MTDADAPDDLQKADLRFTEQADRSVSISRDMSGQGHLARGSSTRMSNIRFSMQAKSRDYLDPELAALHVDPPLPKHVRAAEPAPEPVVNADTLDIVHPDVRSEEKAAVPSTAGRIAQAFRRFVTGQ